MAILLSLGNSSHTLKPGPSSVSLRGALLGCVLFVVSSILRRCSEELVVIWAPVVPNDSEHYFCTLSSEDRFLTESPLSPGGCSLRLSNSAPSPWSRFPRSARAA